MELDAKFPKRQKKKRARFGSSLDFLDSLIG